MVIMDYGTEVLTNENFAAAPGVLAYVLGDKPYDLGVKTDPGQGGDLWMQIEVTEAFSDGTGTPQLQMGLLYSDDNGVPPTNAMFMDRVGSPNNLFNFNAPYLTQGYLTKGTTFNIRMPRITRQMTGALGFSTGASPGVDGVKGTALYMKRWVTFVGYMPLFASTGFGSGRMSARIVLNPGMDDSLSNIYPANFKVV
jgi:hypothetical protein